VGIINPIGDVIAASGRMWLGLLMKCSRVGSGSRGMSRAGKGGHLR